MDITTFDDLLGVARRQPQPQRLLLVFVGASLPDGASAEQRARFEAGEAGELAPLMCVDKGPDEVADFGALAAEAQAMDQPWVLVFAAALDGSGGQRPDAARVDAALQRMVEAVRVGAVERYLAFDRSGSAVQLG